MALVHIGFLSALLSVTQLCQAQKQAQRSSDLLSCETDYFLDISCFLDSRAIPNRTENVTYWLKFKPITPYNVTVEYVNGTYTFAWFSGYEDHEYVRSLPFRYILRYHKVGESTMKELHINSTVYRIPETNFDPGTNYVAKVYNKIIEIGGYRGTTSDGSAEIRWKTSKAERKPESPMPGYMTVTMISTILVIGAVGLMSLLLIPVASKKIKKIRLVGNLTPYVPPLNQTAQFWLLKGHMQQIYREEVSTIDMITEITAKQQLQEHTPSIYSQCHTPYVGPLMEVWAPSLLPDTHITANKSCNNLDFLPEDCNVEETFLCLSTAEGVEAGLVSLDDLEPSLEICKPSEPLAITPNPAFTQNYCTLTNTAIGLIPTFCRVQHVPNLNLELNGHSSPDLLNMQMEDSTPEMETVTLDNLQLSMEE